MFDPALNPLELEPEDFNKLFANNGEYGMNVEECELRDGYDREEYLAVYDAVLEDDGSFPSDDVLYRKCTIFIEFQQNGTLIACL